MPCAGFFLRCLEMSGGDERLLGPDIPKRPDVELGQRALAKPMRTRQWGNDAKSSNAAPFVTSKRQQQQFQLNFRPMRLALKPDSHWRIAMVRVAHVFGPP